MTPMYERAELAKELGSVIVMNRAAYAVNSVELTPVRRTAHTSETLCYGRNA